MQPSDIAGDGSRDQVAAAAQAAWNALNFVLLLWRTMEPTLLSTLDKGVLTLTLNRPAKLNAIDNAWQRHCSARSRRQPMLQTRA